MLTKTIVFVNHTGQIMFVVIGEAIQIFVLNSQIVGKLKFQTCTNRSYQIHRERLNFTVVVIFQISCKAYTGSKKWSKF